MGSLRLEGLGALAKQAAALGQDAKKAVNSALLKGARIITAEAKVRAPRTESVAAVRRAAAWAGLSGAGGVSGAVPVSGVGFWFKAGAPGRVSGVKKATRHDTAGPLPGYIRRTRVAFKA